MTSASNTINSKELSALSVVATAANSSSSSAAAAAGPANNKRKYSSIAETDPHKKIKLEFDAALANVTDLWKKERNSQKADVYPRLTALLQTSIENSHRLAILNLFKNKPAEGDSVKQDSETLSKANESLYKQLKNIKVEAEKNAAAFKLLHNAIIYHQKEMIEKIIADLDLSQDNEDTLICMEHTSESSPDIAKLILAKNPRTTFNGDQDRTLKLHNQFFKLAFVHEDLNLFKYLLDNKFQFFESRAFELITVSSNLVDFLNLFITDPRLEPHFLELLQSTKKENLMAYFKVIFNQVASTEIFSNLPLDIDKIRGKPEQLLLHDWLIKEFVQSIQTSNKPMIETMMVSEALCQTPLILFTAVQSNNDELANKLIKEKGASPTVAISHISELITPGGISSAETIRMKWNTIWTRLNPHLTIISKLITLGANIDKSCIFFEIVQSWSPEYDGTPFSKTIPKLNDYSNDDILSMIKWFVDQGASLYNTKIAAHNSPLVMIVLLNNPTLLNKTLSLIKGLTPSDYSKLINIAFAYSLRACSKEVSEILERAGVVDNHSIIDFQEHLSDLIVQFNDVGRLFEPIGIAQPIDCKELRENIDFLISKGAKPFISKKGARIPPLLECCLSGHMSLLPILSVKDGYYKHLLDTDKDGFGIFTHLSRYYQSDDPETRYVKKFIEQLCIDFSHIPQDKINVKDILSAYIVLKTCRRLKESDFDSILTLIPRQTSISYNELVPIRKLLINENVELSQDAFNKFISSYENVLFQQVPDHYKKGLSTCELSAGQQKEISAIDCHAWLRKMLAATLADKEKAFEIKMGILKPEKEELEVCRKTFDTEQKAYKAELEKFFDIIQKRTHAIGVPPVIPAELNNKKEKSEAFLKFEAETRRIIPNDSYIEILAKFFSQFTKVPYQANDKEKKYFVEINNSLEKITKDTQINILQDLALGKNFFTMVFDKERFFRGLELRISTIIYSSQFGKKNALLPIASASSSSSAAATSPEIPEYNRTEAGSLLTALYEASSYCATQWTTSLITLEDPAINIIQKYTDNTVVHINELTALETALYTVLSDQRKAHIRGWVKKKIENQIASLSARTTDSFLSDEQRKYYHNEGKVQFAMEARQLEYRTILGREVHYFNAALQHCGKDLGIPRCEKIVEDAVYWQEPESDRKDLYEFINNANSPEALIDLIDDGINKHKSIKHGVVADWMKDHLIGDWEKNRYKSYATNLIREVRPKLDSLKNTYVGLFKQHANDVAKIRKNPEEKLRIELTEKSEKEFIGQLERQIFKPLWTYLTTKQLDAKNPVSRISFTPFADTLRSLIANGNLFEGPSSPLLRIITNACSKARIDAFTFKIYDQKALSEHEKFVIERCQIREMLLKLKVIAPIQTTIENFEKHRKALLALNEPAQAVPANQQQPQGQLHANQLPLPQIPLDQLRLQLLDQQRLQLFDQQRLQLLEAQEAEFAAIAARRAAQLARNVLPPPVNRNQPDHPMGVPAPAPMPAAPAPMPAAGPPVYNFYGNGHYDNKDEKG